MSERDFFSRRAEMVDRQLAARGIDDERVLEAMRAVPRDVFVPREYRDAAYADQALPIAGGQTISQPYVVAAICQALALRGDERLLEIGTGSGYSSAVLGRLAREVTTVERHPVLASGARRVLEQLGVTNVTVLLADGSRGLADRAPYDAIAVHALAPEDPGPFLDQLAPGGRLVVPLPGDADDLLTLFTEMGGRFERQVLDFVRFVPLISGGDLPEQR
ncbi:MAG: protein-L-isoaspartate(D-aspartate) O-methyltransferase [Pseudonocardiaceae bacterium]